MHNFLFKTKNQPNQNGVTMLVLTTFVGMAILATLFGGYSARFIKANYSNNPLQEQTNVKGESVKANTTSESPAPRPCVQTDSPANDTLTQNQYICNPVVISGTLSPTKGDFVDFYMVNIVRQGVYHFYLYQPGRATSVTPGSLQLIKLSDPKNPIKLGTPDTIDVELNPDLYAIQISPNYPSVEFAYELHYGLNNPSFEKASNQTTQPTTFSVVGWYPQNLAAVDLQACTTNGPCVHGLKYLSLTNGPKGINAFLFSDWITLDNFPKNKTFKLGFFMKPTNNQTITLVDPVKLEAEWGQERGIGYISLEAGKWTYFEKIIQMPQADYPSTKIRVKLATKDQYNYPVYFDGISLSAIN